MYKIQFDIVEDEVETFAFGANFVIYHDNILQEIPNLKFLPPALIATNNIGSKIFVHFNNTIFDELTEGSTLTVGYNTGI